MSARFSLLDPGRKLVRGLLHLVYPPHCLVCGEPVSGDPVPLCPVCDRGLFADPGPACPRCGGKIGPFANVAGGCGACRAESFAFDRVLRLGAYEGLLRDVVLRLKHHSGETLAELVGRRWARRDDTVLRSEGVQWVVPVPLHWRRRWVRGYNQSAALAQGLAAALRLPCRPWSLRRTRHTPRQAGLLPLERRTNVQDAFGWRGQPLDGQCVLLVDDVFTTGATAQEAAQVLRRAGAGRVVVAALARAGHL